MSVPPPPSPLTLRAATLVRVHTALAATAFLLALSIGCLSHYKNIVKNDVAGYPEEWFPSVSATIGDWFPERNIFQILIALCSGPRISLVCFQYLIHRASSLSRFPPIVFIFGIIRTLACGGWVFITSSDDHDIHDVCMILYMVCNIPWMLGGVWLTQPGQRSVYRKRVIASAGFFLALVPLVYFYLQHKVHRVPGAYTQYSLCEWSLILFDVWYDSHASQEFDNANLLIMVNSGSNVTVQPNGASLTSSVKGVHSTAVENPRPDGSVSGAAKPTSKTAIPLKRRQLPFDRKILSFTADIYLSYIFWAIYTSLIPTLFYFSVWELGIAGHELALFTTLSPILLAIPPLLADVRTRNGQTLYHAFSFLGLFAFLLKSPGQRLLVVGIANAALILRQAVQWAGTEGDGPHGGQQGLLTGLGLLIASLSKHANHSNNPVWPFTDATSSKYNFAGLTLAILALAEYTTRERPDKETKPTKDSENDKVQVSQPSNPSSHWLSASLALGSLLFSLHNMLSDPSTLVAWSWTGYEQGAPRGPVPHLHASLTIVAQCVGLLLGIVFCFDDCSSLSVNTLAHPIWWLYGAISAVGLYSYRNWAGYFFGLNFALFLMSIIPLVLQAARSASTTGVARVFTTTWLVSCLLNLASIFTVAYAFVPGGQYLRERTDAVLFVQLALLSLVFDWHAILPLKGLKTLARQTTSTLDKTVASYSRSTLAVITTLGLLSTIYHWPTVTPRPFKPGSRIITAGIWTLHFGIDNTGRDSQRGALKLIRDMELDVVGLLETDLHRTAFGHRDLTRIIVEEMGYHVDIGPGPNSHTWGAVLLSKFPIINTTHHLLPSPRGELAPAIKAVLDVYGTEITVVVSHNGQEEDPLDRELQSKKLAEIMSATFPRPVIFLGYVVTLPRAQRPAPYEILVTDGRVHDIDHDDQDRWCEYILYRGLYRTSYARLSRGSITDTELQVGQFVVPKHNTPVVDETEGGRYLRAFKEELPTEHWFPMAYYPEQGGVNGHSYHVFDTPLYYKIPQGAIL